MPDRRVTAVLDELEARWRREADGLYNSARDHAIGALDGDAEERVMAKERLAEVRTLERAITDLQKVRAAANF